jgi:PIN domain nuclease of toxin-antitoxin system
MKILKPEVIFDACALVSFIKPQTNEKGIELLERHFGKFGMSTINIAEVIDVLMRKGVEKTTILHIIKKNLC